MILLASTTFAASSLVTSSLDGGGGHSASVTYAIDGGVGDIGGTSSGGGISSMPGYDSQLTEIVSLSVTSTPLSVNETSTAQLSGVATYDDATTAALTGSDISWDAPSFPIASINGSGLAMMSAVYQNTAGPFGGSYLGVTNSGSLLVIDSLPDNYGSYAADGLPDAWQIQYFGLDNPNAAPTADVDGTGQNNLFKYVAGLDPTNPASVFVLKIASVTGQPNQNDLIYNPIAGGRTYTVESRTNLLSGSYAALGNFSGPITNVNQVTVTVTDTNAVEAQKFYHVHISLP